MFADFLNHRCDIYHMEDVTVDVGYGINTGDTRSTDASGEPDETDIPCHFNIGQGLSVKVVQKEPYSDLEGSIKLALPYGTDIRINDLVVDKTDGIAYRATGTPRTVHGNHHIVVQVQREEGMVHAI